VRAARFATTGVAVRQPQRGGPMPAQANGLGTATPAQV